MTTPTKHLEIFDEKFPVFFEGAVSWSEDSPNISDIKQHLIQTVISVLEEEIKETQAKRRIYCTWDDSKSPEEDLSKRIVRDKALESIENSLTTTLSTWHAMLETIP